jgi:glycerol-3-phosphate dehydrogenase
MGGHRERTLEELGRGVFDVLVIGGGIVGGRVAFDAARLGLRVALVDAGDFGGATSGASARLVHGGLRYLGTGDLRLVRTALRERDVFASRVAPHLVRPLPFVLSAAGGRRQRSRCAAGLLVYTALDGFRSPLPRFVTPEEATLLVPPLSVGDTASHAVYFEAGTNDSRLTLATVTAAARSGAVVANYLRAVNLDLAPGKISRVSLQGRGVEITVRCRAVVNATGPWLDLLRNLEDSACEPVTRLSKGIHVVLRPDEQWRAAVAVSLEGGQHLYAVPCEDMILLGTTEQEYHGDPAAVAAEPEDVSYLLQVARCFLRPQIQQSERQRARKDNARSAGPLGAGLPCGSRRVGLDRRGRHLPQNDSWSAWLRYARDPAEDLHRSRSRCANPAPRTFRVAFEEGSMRGARVA